MIFLVGALAHPMLRMRLAPGAVEVEGLPGHALQGGQGAGIAPDGWPALVPAQGRVPLWRTDWTPALTRYAHIFGLEPVAVAGRDILGVAARAREGAGRWDPELAAALADHLLALPPDRPAGAVRARLPLIAAWVASTLRAARDSRDLPALGPAGDDRLQVLAVEEPYAEFFSVQEITLRHRRHRGGWTPEVLRAVFVSGDAAVVLPWDPLRDRVLLIDQFRAGPAARGDRQPWFWEALAGRVDPTETPEQAVLREAIEETGLAIDRLIPGPHNYPSPGLLAEFLYLYVGIADLPDDVAGFGGLDTENEDIRSQLLPRAELTRMALAGQVRNGPLLSLALWLELNQQKIRMELGQDKPGLIP